MIDYFASGDKKYVNIVFLQEQYPSNEWTTKNSVVSRKEKSLQNARRDNNMKGETWKAMNKVGEWNTQIRFIFCRGICGICKYLLLTKIAHFLHTLPRLALLYDFYNIFLNTYTHTYSLIGLKDLENMIKFVIAERL